MSTEDGNAVERGTAVTGSEGTTSPRSSSAISGSEVRQTNTGGILVDAGAPGLDTHHWAGVRRGPREGDARSVASSLAAEKDALSVYDNQESDLEGEGRDDKGMKSLAVAEEDEMNLHQEEDATDMAREPSVMEEDPVGLPRGTPISELDGGRSLLQGMDGDDALSAAGTMSPLMVEMPAGGVTLGSAPLPRAEGSLLGDAASTVGAVDGTDRASDVASLDLPSASVTASPRRGGTDDGDDDEPVGVTVLESGVADETKAAPVEGDGQDIEADVAAVSLEDTIAHADVEAVSLEDTTADVAAPVAEESSEAFAANENATVVKRSPPAEEGHDGDSEAEVARRGLALQALVEGRSQNPIHDAAVVDASEGDASAAPVPGGIDDADAQPDLANPPRTMEALETEGPAASITAAAAAAAAGADVLDASQAPPGAAVLPEEYAPAWESAFQGLVHSDGVDSLGRPVVVLDADAVPPGMKASAARYVVAHLSPLVERGDYVLVLTARRAALPSMWVMGAYTSLPRPFRKNVKLIVLVRPSGFLRAMLTLLRPLMSAKAAKKLRVVDGLRDIGTATEGQVEVGQLGGSFLATPDVREELSEQGTSDAGVAPSHVSQTSPETSH